MTVAQRKRAQTASRAASSVVRSKTISRNPIAALRVGLSLPRSKFARLLGRTERAVIDWESGKSSPQGLSQQRIQELQRLTKALGGLFESKTLGKWFDTPNDTFGGLKPIEVIERGESDRLWEMIFQLKAGTHV